MILDGITDATIVRRITMLDEKIHAAPQEFQRTIESVGGMLLSQTIEVQEIAGRVPRAVRKPEELLKEYFTNRYDLDHDFDPDTEQAIKDDPYHAELLNKVKARTVIPVKSRRPGNERYPNEQTLSARDELRLFRLRTYVGRVVSANEISTIDKKLPSAG